VLEADSLDARIPAQQLEQSSSPSAAPAARRSTPRTSPPAASVRAAAAATDRSPLDRDWILGDTITGYFVAVAPEAQDTTAAPASAASAASDAPEPLTEVVLDRVLAVGSARSLYRVESNREGTGGRRGINYIVGEAISLTFRDGEIDVADVRGLHRGLFLDPEAPAAAPAEDGPETPATGPVARGTPQRR
jgi:hypothetical protein